MKHLFSFILAFLLLTGCAAETTQPVQEEASPKVSASETISQTVYITATGSKYHQKECQHLSKSCIAIDVDEAKARGYTACSRCW